MPGPAGRPLAHTELTVGGTELTVGGIVKHLARIEDLWFGRTFAGHTGTEPWASAVEETAAHSGHADLLLDALRG